MSPGALIAAGMGPPGRSVYLRDAHVVRADRGVSVARDLGARVVFVNFSRGDRKAIIEAHGGGWLYGLPGPWRPGEWRRTLETCLARVREVGADGMLADVENGWTRAHADEARELGRALAAAARETRVGVTSYPSLPVLDELASECRGWVWGSPQIYGQARQDGGPTTPADWRAWHARWTRAWGPGSVIPSVAAGPGGLVRPQAFHRSEEGMRSYLAAIPHGAGAIFWPGASVPDYVSAAARSYEPGGSAVGTLGYAIRDALVRPGGAVVVALVAALVVGVGMTTGGLLA